MHKFLSILLPVPLRGREEWASGCVVPVAGRWVKLRQEGDAGHRIVVLCTRIGKMAAGRTETWVKSPQKQLGEKQKVDCWFLRAFLPPGDGIPTVFVAVAGRSNGLGPVMSGNTAYPVVNCPPLSADWGTQDVWSSLRLPSGKMICSLRSCTRLALFCCCCSSVRTCTNTPSKTLEK